MFKKSIALCFVFLLLFQGAAFALEGDIIFRDSLYGAAIGALVGLGLYAIDQNDAGAKIGGGVVAGTAIGALVGVAETRSMVRIDGESVIVSVPTPRLDMEDGGLAVRSDLVRFGF